MIYITGDTHGEFERFSTKRLRKQGMEPGEQDYVIVCGDFGLCWKRNKTFEYHCKYFAGKKYTILWVQGNHENYDMIAEYPVEEWHGGKVRHIVRDKVILLERGQVFEIDGKTFFTFGGASSHDVQGGILDRQDADYGDDLLKALRSELPFRIKHESWWEEELPNEKEMEEGRRNLANCNYKVDYVITHCCATSILDIMDRGPARLFEPDVLTDYLQEIEDKLEYSCWYFGHYHMDRKIDARHILLYHAIVPLEGDGHVYEPAIRAYFLRASYQVVYRGYLSEIRGLPRLQQECSSGEVENTALNEEFMLLGGRDAVALGKPLNRSFYDEDGKFVTVFAGDLLVLRYRGDTFASVREEDVEKIESMLKPIDHIAGGTIFLKESETLPEWKEKAATE